MPLDMKPEPEIILEQNENFDYKIGDELICVNSDIIFGQTNYKEGDKYRIININNKLRYPYFIQKIDDNIAVVASKRELNK